MNDTKFSACSMQLIGSGKQDCSDGHRWGPGIRPCYIIHHVIRGRGYLKINGKEYNIKQGESFLTFPNTVIEYYPDREDPWTYEWVDFVGKDARDWVLSTGFDQQHPICNIPLHDKIHGLFEKAQILDLFQKNSGEAAGVLLTILGIYHDCMPLWKRKSERKVEERYHTAIMLITSNYHKPSFGVESLCGMMNIDRVTLYRTFQELEHSSPSQYLISYRIEQSKKLLANGVPVKIAAFSSGFSDPFYYSRLFKKRNGITPSLFQQRMLDDNL